MSITHSTTRGALAIAGLALIVVSTALNGQAPVKPPRDSIAKPKTPVGTSKATTRVKIAKEQTAAGEVVALPVTRDTVVTTVYVTDSSRDALIRADQHGLDSIANALVRNRLRTQMARRVRDTEMRVRAELLAKTNAEVPAAKRSLSRGMYFGIAGGASAPGESGLATGQPALSFPRIRTRTTAVFLMSREARRRTCSSAV
jgi:hypothetical protein